VKNDGSQNSKTESRARRQRPFFCNAISHQDTKTLSYTKGFIKNKSFVPLCLGGINKENKNAGIKRNHQKVQ
jgi:hypothetical protein